MRPSKGGFEGKNRQQQEQQSNTCSSEKSVPGGLAGAEGDADRSGHDEDVPAAAAKRVRSASHANGAMTIWQQPQAPYGTAASMAPAGVGAMASSSAALQGGGDLASPVLPTAMVRRGAAHLVTSTVKPGMMIGGRSQPRLLSRVPLTDAPPPPPSLSCLAYFQSRRAPVSGSDSFYGLCRSLPPRAARSSSRKHRCRRLQQRSHRAPLARSGEHPPLDGRHRVREALRGRVE